MNKPQTVESAYSNGQHCREIGHNHHYNPYRNMDASTNDLSQAWIEGWHEANERLKSKETM